MIGVPPAIVQSSNAWTWDGERGEIAPSFSPLAARPGTAQFLWSIYSLPTAVSEGIGNDFWLRVGDLGLRFEEQGVEASLGYPTTVFRAWRLMVGDHFSVAGLPFMGPDDRGFFYGGLTRGSGYLDSASDGKTYSSDAGIGLAFMGGISATRGPWTYRLGLDDLGFINWNDTLGSGVPAPRTQELTPHMVAEEQWNSGAWGLTLQEVAMPTGAQGRIIGGYQCLRWLAPRLSVGIDTQGTPQLGIGAALQLGAYVLNMGLTATNGSALPVMGGIQTGAAW